MTGSSHNVAGPVAGGGNSTLLRGCDAGATAAADGGDCSGGHLNGKSGPSDRSPSQADASRCSHEAQGSRTGFGERTPPGGRTLPERRRSEDRRRSGERLSGENRCGRDRRRSDDQYRWAPAHTPRPHFPAGAQERPRAAAALIPGVALASLCPAFAVCRVGAFLETLGCSERGHGSLLTA